MKCIKGHPVDGQGAPCETCPYDATDGDGACGAECLECNNGTYIAVDSGYLCDNEECGDRHFGRRG